MASAQRLVRYAPQLLMISGGPKTVTLSAQQRTDFHSVLSASGRSQEIPESADVYGWLVGSWELEVHDY
jgi:hypothetical protein